MSRSIFFWLSIFVALALLFIFEPKIDLVVSGFFYRDGVFYLAKNPLVQLSYHYAPLISLIIGLVSFLMLILDSLAKREFFGVKKRVWSYLLFALLLGPGLLVNLVLKDHLGRARPRQVVEFGGDKNFTPAFIPANQCKQNCSFPSGHSAGAFYLIALALLAKRRRLLWLSLATLFGVLVSLGRIIQGGHFLSDTIFSFFFVFFISWLLYYWFFKKEDS